MILLDTNVISEPQRREPNARVLDWIDAQALETLYLSAITVAELRAGIALMPAGKRRDGLHENLEKRLLPMFANRVLPFDMACTKAYAELLVTSRAAGLAFGHACLLKRGKPRRVAPPPRPEPAPVLHQGSRTTKTNNQGNKTSPAGLRPDSRTKGGTCRPWVIDGRG